MRIEPKIPTYLELEPVLPNPMCDEVQYLRSFGFKEPNQSECARTGKRSLSWFFWVPAISGGWKNSILDRNNLELSHEHIFFSGSGDNIGWGKRGLFTEDSRASRYKLDSTCYNGETMRRAIASSLFSTSYGYFSNNCQDFVERIRDSYRKLSK